MYTSSTASREKALLAAAAAERAMKRYECCKSQFKFKCFACGEMINRGDKITHCNRAPTGMTLRYRGADSQNGLTAAEVTFYQAYTGNNMWVHVGCIPCYWDSLPEHCNEYSRPRLRPICTDWGVKVYGEWEEWRTWEGEAWQHMDVPYFCWVKGYPKEKFMRDRIIHAVKRFQAIWRGYIYKKAYPIARREARATEAINLNARATLSTKSPNMFLALAVDRKRPLAICASSPPHNHYARIKANLARDDAEREAMFYCHNKDRVGRNSAILFDRGRQNEAIYSCESMAISGESNGVQVYVRFHYDQERRKYHWKRFELLEKECNSFMIERGIRLIEFEGKIPTNPHFWNGHN